MNKNRIIISFFLVGIIGFENQVQAVVQNATSIDYTDDNIKFDIPF